MLLLKNQLGDRGSFRSQKNTRHFISSVFVHRDAYLKVKKTF